MTMTSATESTLAPVDQAIHLYERRIAVLRELKEIDEQTPRALAAVYAGVSTVTATAPAQRAASSAPAVTTPVRTAIQQHVHATTTPTKTRGKPGPKPRTQTQQVAKTTRTETPRKVQPHERNYNNEKPLHAVIVDVLSREGAEEGLNANEICEMIQKEQLWESSSPDISNMVQGQIHALRKKQIVIRGDERRYMLNPNPPAEA